MSSNVGTNLIHQLLDFYYGNTALTPPATIYVALFTTTPTNLLLGTGGTEVSGGGYARAAITNNGTNFAAAASRAKTNATTINFASPSAGWGTVVGFGIYDAASGGTWLGGADLTTSKTINSGDPVSFASGTLTFFSVT